MINVQSQSYCVPWVAQVAGTIVSVSDGPSLVPKMETTVTWDDLDIPTTNKCSFIASIYTYSTVSL